MANEEHVKTLRQGVEAWNKWRKENPEVIPDLNGAIIIEANVSRMNRYSFLHICIAA